MKTGQWILMALAAAGLACAQDGNRPVQKAIEVKYRDPDRIARLVLVPGVTPRADKEFHVIVVSGPAQAVTEYEEMVKKFDTPPLNIELTVYLMNGNSRDAADDLPKDLAATAKQLHGIFAYKSYRVMQSFVIRSREAREINDSGTLPGSSSEYSFHCSSSSISQGSPRVVHIDQMQLRIVTPTGEHNKDGNPVSRYANIQSDIDIGENQKVVVGKSSTNSADDALILVVTAKVVE